jgi:adenylate kinase
MSKQVVVIFGPPGSGKGTQADLVADVLGLIHVDTGKIIRSIFSDPAEMKKAVNKREKKINDAGVLNTPSWVVGVLKRRVRAVAKMGYGLAFSGSPRTLYEAERIIPFLEKLFGRKNLNFFLLKVPLDVAAKRNRVRLVCTTCKRPLLVQYYPTKNPKNCPVCAGVLKRRIDDDPAKFKTRWAQYLERTEPVLEYVRRHGYKIASINGELAPYKVHQNIVKRVGT